MQCKKCGATLLDNDKFCGFCGEKVLNENLVNSNFFQQNSVNNINQSNNYSMGINQENVNNDKKSNKKNNNALIIILIIVGVSIVGLISFFVLAFLGLFNNSEKMICKSDAANITIIYNDQEIIGYTAKGMNYDLDEQKKYAKTVGVNSYLLEFNSWFSANTNGKCSIDGEDVAKKLKETDTSLNSGNNKNSNDDLKIVGDDKYGYVDVPKTWAKFYDINKNTALQYSYANQYILSLNYLDGSEYNAKDYATNFMNNQKNSNEVSGVVGATVKIGKNKNYTAYQVYMYYPNEAKFLVTYWFDAEDGNVHYIALEGYEDLANYLYIAESFRLKK